jgi:hypothetical protein
LGGEIIERALGGSISRRSDGLNLSQQLLKQGFGRANHIGILGQLIAEFLKIYSHLFPQLFEFMDDLCVPAA